MVALPKYVVELTVSLHKLSCEVVGRMSDACMQPCCHSSLYTDSNNRVFRNLCVVLTVITTDCLKLTVYLFISVMCALVQF